MASSMRFWRVSGFLADATDSANQRWRLYDRPSKKRFAAASFASAFLKSAGRSTLRGFVSSSTVTSTLSPAATLAFVRLSALRGR